MAYLFLDTSYEVHIGLLDKQFNWIEEKRIKEKKVSKLLQVSILNILNENGLTIDDIDIVFQCSGPGSYTGMRLSEGLVQILEWLDVETYSFYHFNIPSYLGEKSYIWMSSAFKGEYFVFDSAKGKINLIKRDDFKFDSSNQKYFTHDKNEFEDSFVSTSELITKNSKQIFKKIYETKTREEIYYYRKEEDEFKIKDKTI